jgi:hypothetical protein
MDQGDSKGERRERKRRKRREMRIIGRSVRLLQEIIRRRAEKLRKREDPDPGDPSRS